MSANSWMQTPDGVVPENGRLVVTVWWKVIASPSWPYRLPQMLMAAWITGSFAVAGIGAWYLLKGRHEAFGRRTVSMGTSRPTAWQAPTKRIIFGCISTQTGKASGILGRYLVMYMTACSGDEKPSERTRRGRCHQALHDRRSALTAASTEPSWRLVWESAAASRPVGLRSDARQSGGSFRVAVVRRIAATTSHSPRDGATRFARVVDPGILARPLRLA